MAVDLTAARDAGAERDAVPTGDRPRASLSPREIAQEIVLDVLADERQDRVAVFAEYRSEIDRAETWIRAALASAGPDGDGWRPIKTAPKDGTQVLLFSGIVLRVGWWDEGNAWWRLGGEMYLRNATHWRPLPAPPVLPAGAHP